MDPLLDDALAAARLWRRDYLLMVNGVIRPDRLDLLLGSQSPGSKSSSSMAISSSASWPGRWRRWTIFSPRFRHALKPAVAGRDVLVVGH